MQRHRHRVFKGSVLSGNEITEWKKVGWTRISVLRDGTNPLLDGAFSVHGVQYHIKVKDGAMVVSYKAEDQDPIMSSESLTNITDIDTTPHFAPQKRQFGFNPNPPNLVDTIGSIDGCPTDRRIALVGIATDCAFTGTFSSQEDLVDSVVSMVNTASAVFEETFNIALAVANLTIEEEDCPSSPSSELPWNVGCASGIDLNWRLQQFTSWRENSGGSENAYWTLMSGCPTGTEVGVSWVGELCHEELSANVVAVAQNQWQVFAYVAPSPMAHPPHESFMLGCLSLYGSANALVIATNPPTPSAPTMIATRAPAASRAAAKPAAHSQPPPAPPAATT
jgi:hypothetical protein